MPKEAASFFLNGKNPQQVRRGSSDHPGIVLPRNQVNPATLPLFILPRLQVPEPVREPEPADYRERYARLFGHAFDIYAFWPQYSLAEIQPGSCTAKAVDRPKAS